MDVYIDIIFIENMIIDLFLMLVTLRLLRLNYSKRGIYLSAILGGVYGLVPITNSEILNSMFFKIAIAILLVTLSLKEKVFSNILKATVMFFMVSFTLCGVSFIGVMYSTTYTISGGMDISNYSVKWILISLLFVGVIAIRIYDTVNERAVIENFIYE